MLFLKIRKKKLTKKKPNLLTWLNFKVWFNYSYLFGFFPTFIFDINIHMLVKVSHCLGF